MPLDDNLIATLESAALLADAARKPLADVLVKFARAAKHEVDESEARAVAAEEALADVEPELEKIAKRAEALHEQLLEKDEALVARETADVARRIKAERIARDHAAAAKDEAALATVVAELTEAIKAQQPVVDLLVAVHQRTKDAHGQSAIRNRREYGQWEVYNRAGIHVTTVEKRSEAIQLVREMLAVERRLPDEYYPATEQEEQEGDARGAAEQRSHDEAVPGHAGRVDGRRVGTKKIVKRRLL
jgi:hypothetical protein